ncbi:hypothetical protein BK147_01330 [Paenibacillus sp. FSL R7-0337]|nr:hypothetical protein BK147_01330 [Paenibacillus sp. FSL R7-0337]
MYLPRDKIRCLLRYTKEINEKQKETEGKFGTVGAIATAFVNGFQPRRAGKLKKSVDGQRPEVQMFSAVTTKLRVQT